MSSGKMTISAKHCGCHSRRSTGMSECNQNSPRSRMVRPASAVLGSLNRNSAKRMAKCDGDSNRASHAPISGHMACLISSCGRAFRRRYSPRLYVALFAHRQACRCAGEPGSPCVGTVGEAVRPGVHVEINHACQRVLLDVLRRLRETQYRTMTIGDVRHGMNREDFCMTKLP